MHASESARSSTALIAALSPMSCTASGEPIVDGRVTEYGLDLANQDCRN